MTHLYLDHAGGLPDFPQTRVHLFQPELDHATRGRAGWEYIPAHWAHKPNWVPHRLGDERWHDFNAIQLSGFSPEIWLVPLTGHLPGHVGVEVRGQAGWDLHAGDAVPFDMALDRVPDQVSR